ncbi:inositol monophosphatase [SAR202 cluster bacterium AD-804-J14_MRT_500m]|nr:inositol monophosphatase [SAR202 cluster bacterium AD-804-J14_MRT_500m]
MDDVELQELEQFSIDIAREAGAILLDAFQKPLKIEYKSKNNLDPVTDVDKRSEEFLKEAILQRYPGHAILAEEGSMIDVPSADVTWVIDPLDGTVNFMNGLPIFGVSIGVLYKGHPVVGSIFVPTPKTLKGSVFHARRGGGAFHDDSPIRVPEFTSPQSSRISIFPAFWIRSLRIKNALRSQMGELRAAGSTAYELAMVSCGVIQYAFFGSPWIWDVAAGIIIVTEAQGVALTARKRLSDWGNFDGFHLPEGDRMTLTQLKSYRPAWVFGRSDVARFVTSNITPRGRLEIKMGQWLRRWF